MHGDLDAAVAGQSITLTLADELDCSRGDLIAAADAPPEIADQFEATIVWMGEEPLLPGRSYWLKIGATTVIASVNELKHEVNRSEEHTSELQSLMRLSYAVFCLTK